MMADAEKGEGSVSEQAAVQDSGADGIRTRRAFMLKQLLPGDGQDWINKNVAAKGKGHRVLAGRVFGIIMGCESKANTLPDGKVINSIVLFGQFEYECLLKTERGSASSVYLPMAYAQQVAAAFAADATIKALEMDIDIGIEATGKTIAFEWLVINHIGEQLGLLQRLRSRRRPGTAALAAPPATPALNAPDANVIEGEAETVSDDAEPAQEKDNKKKR